MFMIKYIYGLCKKYRLKRTTLFLAVFYFDKFLEIEEDLDEESFTTAAQAAAYIAMKYEEIYPPSIYDWTGSKSRPKIFEM